MRKSEVDLKFFSDHSPRLDLDGLRGIAVILVFFFHLGLINSGFIGVDIFFTLSGFLITLKIEKLQNKKDFFNFLIKRFKRLCPSIFVVSSISMTVGWLILPNETLFWIKSFISIFFNYYNFFFFFNSIDYFNELSTFNFLTHFWTLSVEVQFYILTSIVFIFFKIYFTQKILYIFLIIAFVVSIFLSYDLSEIKSFYYFTPIRYFEFLIGSFAALTYKMNYKFKGISRPQLSRYYSVAGIILLFLGIFYFNTSNIYPSMHALIPCFATLFLIKGSFGHSFKQVGVSNFLSFGILPTIGKISYSIYLVHFPIIIFLTLYIDNQILLIFISLILTYLFSKLLFNFVENKFRYEKLNHFFYKYIVLFLFAFPLLLIINFDFMLINEKGKILFHELKIEKLNRSSFDYKKTNITINNRIKNFNNDELDTILIIGDSHADNIFMIFSDNFNNNRYYKVSKIHVDTICLNNKHRKKITGYFVYGFRHKGTCQVQIENLVNTVKKNNIKYFILSNYYNSETFMYFEPYINKFFDKKNIIIIPQVVDFVNFNKSILLSTKINSNKNISSNISNESLEIRKKMINYAENNFINYFDINKSLCVDESTCLIYDGNIKKFLFVDSFGHISSYGAHKIKLNFFTYLNSILD